jgi:NitT/TauT family transport system ATP-binding protein
MNKPTKTQLTVDKLDYSYKSSKKSALAIFSQLSLMIHEGEFVSVIGPSGCGKSTLLKLIMGLQRADAGSILVGDKVMRGPSTSIGMVFQQDSLLPWRTALKNVCLGLERNMQRADAHRAARAALEQVGLSKFADTYPHQLSGGMRQRVNLARALALSPEVVLMDEPFASLDMLTRERMQEHLIMVWERDRKTVIFVTHQLEEAVYLSDRVIILGSAPAGIVADVAVDLPRPRTAETKKSMPYHRLVDELAELLTEASGQATANSMETGNLAH